MKRCPTCNRSFADDTLTFCLDDGARLELEHDPEATVIAQPRKTNSHRVYQVIIALLLLVGLAVVLRISKLPWTGSVNVPAMAGLDDRPPTSTAAAPSMIVLTPTPFPSTFTTEFAPVAATKFTSAMRS